MLFIISLADVILRTTVFSDLAATITNYGEVLIAAVLSVLLIIFALKGNDRLFNVVCGAFLGCFVFNQLFGLPGLIAEFVSTQSSGSGITIENVGILLHAISMICVIASGVLLAGYMSGGSVCNKDFIFFCVTAILMLFAHSVYGIYGLISKAASIDVLLAILSNLQRMAMVLLFAFFAFNSAKMPLKKDTVSK